MPTEAFLDITVVLTSPDGVESSFFLANPSITAFEAMTTSSVITLGRLAFTHYDLVQVSVNDTVGGTDSAYCWNVSQATPC